MPTQGHTGPVVLPSGSIPSYLVYRVDSDDSLPKGFPTVATGPAKAGRTTGPLHLDAAVKAQLDQALAQDGKVAVYNGKNTLLVKPFAPLFGSAGAGDNGTTLTWLASQAAATRSASSSSSNSSTGVASSSTSVPTTVPDVAAPDSRQHRRPDYEFQADQGPSAPVLDQPRQDVELEPADPERLEGRPGHQLATKCGSPPRHFKLEDQARRRDARSLQHRHGNTQPGPGARAGLGGHLRTGRLRSGGSLAAGPALAPGVSAPH